MQVSSLPKPPSHSPSDTQDVFDLASRNDPSKLLGACYRKRQQRGPGKWHLELVWILLILGYFAINSGLMAGFYTMSLQRELVYGPSTPKFTWGTAILISSSIATPTVRWRISILSFSKPALHSRLFSLS